MKYVDTNVFIHAIQGNSSAIALLNDIAQGKIEAATSCLTWDELIWVLRRGLPLEKANLQGRKFLSFPRLIFLPVNQETISQAQRLMESFHLKPRDAIHGACAIISGIKEIISDDSDFDHCKELRRIPLKL